MEEHGSIIGSDEVLKGDTFGGIVVAAVKADREKREQLVALGVTDSKLITDSNILMLAPKIEQLTACIVKNIYPSEYNAFKGSITDMLNHFHKECYNYLKPGTHIVDKFPGCTVGDIIETHAESKYIEVAAASVIARAHGLKQLNDLSKRAGFTIPKGSTHVADALQKLKEHNLYPSEFVKLDFKNVKEALGLR